MKRIDIGIIGCGNISHAYLKGAARSQLVRVKSVSDLRCWTARHGSCLARSGYEVDVAADGAAGWEALQAKRYDLLITDNFMPKVTGIEMVKKLRTARMRLPVIMATAILPEEEFILHPWLQAVTTLIKPFLAPELLATVQKVLSMRESASEQIAPPN
jgi:DNA-binding response OmpR family regulator